MKNFPTLFLAGALFAGLAPAYSASSTNVSFTWTPAPAADLVVRANLYELLPGGGRALLAFITNQVAGQAPTNFLTVTNWTRTAGVARTVVLTFVNAVGEESPASNSCVVPGNPPAAPINLAPVPLSLVVPVPGVAEISGDLADWRQRIRLEPDEAGVLLTWVTYPTDPALYLRAKNLSMPTTPPLPGLP